MPGMMKKLIVLNPRPTPSCLKWIGHEDDLTVVKTWPEVLRILQKNNFLQRQS